MLKLVIYLLCILSFNVLAVKNIRLELDFDLSIIQVDQPEMSEVKGFSLKVNEYIQSNYDLNNRFMCGWMSGGAMTPDQILKYEYKSGMVKIVSVFGYTSNVKVFTPIRQLVSNPDKAAVFDGYYFISSNR